MADFPLTGSLLFGFIINNNIRDWRFILFQFKGGFKLAFYTRATFRASKNRFRVYVFIQAFSRELVAVSEE
jgi:hypothetical protein